MEKLFLILVGGLLLLIGCDSPPKTYGELESKLAEVDARGSDTMRCLVHSVQFNTEERVAFLGLSEVPDSTAKVGEEFFRLLESAKKEPYIDVILTLNFIPSCLPNVGVEDSPLTALYITSGNEQDRERIQNLKFHGVGSSVHIKMGNTKVFPTFSSFENFPGVSGVDRFLIRFPDKEKILESLSENNTEFVIDNVLPETGIRVLKIGGYNRLFGE